MKTYGLQLDKKDFSYKLPNALKKLQDLDFIDQCALQSIQTDLQELMSDLQRTRGKKPRITCAGIYNSGKSSLLNTLTDGTHFVVGDIPTTATIDELESNNVIYVDTPGLNANDYDNKTAQKAFLDADLILFVSNIQNGGLSAAESEYLKRLSDALGGVEQLRVQTLFVLSNLHQVEDTGVVKIV